jgi:integrase
MSVQKNSRRGKWEVRWREGGRQCSRLFDRKSDAVAFDTELRRRRQLGQVAGAVLRPKQVTFGELVVDYWRLHAIPNLSKNTRCHYRQVWAKHLEPRIAEWDVRNTTAKRITRLRADLEAAGVGPPTIIKAMTIVQGMLTFAGSEDIVEYNVARLVAKPRAERQRDPQIFTPVDVERIRATCEGVRDATLVAVLAYSGPRPEEVVCRLAWEDIGERAIRYRDTKRHRVRYSPLLAPLAEDLRAWFLASGRPDGKRPVFPAHDGDFWQDDDWRNWRRRIWQSRPERKGTRRNKWKDAQRARPGIAPPGSRPRDLRSSFVVLQTYAGVPWPQLAREVGTSVRMLERHYYSVLSNWDGRQVPADQQIRNARATPRKTA